MTNRNLLIFSAATLLLIPLLLLVSFTIWFESRYAQLEDYEDSHLVSQRWRMGDTTNSCHFDLVKEKNITTFAHPNEIWSRSPNAWQQGKNAHSITEPRGIYDEVYFGFLIRHERVFLSYKENQADSTVFVRNAVRIKISQPICDFYRR